MQHSWGTVQVLAADHNRWREFVAAHGILCGDCLADCQPRAWMGEYYSLILVQQISNKTCLNSSELYWKMTAREINTPADSGSNWSERSDLAEMVD